MTDLNPNTNRISFDPETIQQLAGGSSDFIKELISIFLEDVPETINQMENALSESDYLILGQLAHKMKSSIGIIGAHELYDLVCKIETASEASSLHDSLPELVRSLNQKMTQCYSDLEQYSQSV